MSSIDATIVQAIKASIDTRKGYQDIFYTKLPSSFLQAMKEYTIEAPRASDFRKNLVGFLFLGKWLDKVSILGLVHLLTLMIFMICKLYDLTLHVLCKLWNLIIFLNL